MTFSLKKQIAAAVAMAGTLGFVLTGCGPAAPEAAPSSGGDAAGGIEALLEQAREEGQLNITWGEGILGGTQAAGPLMEGFRAYYGLDDFPVTYTPGPPATQMAATLAQEVAAGQPATSDIYLGYAPQFAGLLEVGTPIFREIDWAAWAEEVPAEAIGGDGVGVGIVTNIPVITYNSQAVETPPTSMEELLEPAWKGRVASTPYASNFHYFAAENGEEEVLDYLRVFSEQISGLIICTQQDRLLTGEFDALAFDCDHTAALRNERAGGDLRYAVPTDATMLTYISLGVPVNASHPAAAQLWINYMMSREAQDILWEIYGSDSIHVEGSHMAEILAEYEADGVEFSSWSLDDLLESGTFPEPAYLEKQVAILSGTE
jgi:ABC-type thiamine transport system substrate-binding protein